MMDVTGVEISWACLSARKETLETFKLRDYQTDQPHRHNPDGAIRSLEGFQQMIVIQCITANFAQIMTWRFTGEDLAEECFPSGCCLQHYADTRCQWQHWLRDSGSWGLVKHAGSNHYEIQGSALVARAWSCWGCHCYLNWAQASEKSHRCPKIKICKVLLHCFHL